MRAPTRILALAVLLVLVPPACGGSLLSAEVVVERFCIRQAALAGASGMPQIPIATPLPVTFTPPVAFPMDLPPTLRSSGSSVVLRLLDGTLTATPAGKQVQGITQLGIDFVPPSGPAIPALSYVRAGTGASPVTVLPMAGHNLDLVGLIQGSTLNLQVTIATDAAVPTTAGTWNLDIEMCFYGKTVISYL
jgi:hypothetical protein